MGHFPCEGLKGDIYWDIHVVAKALAKWDWISTILIARKVFNGIKPTQCITGALGIRQSATDFGNFKRASGVRMRYSETNDCWLTITLSRSAYLDAMTYDNATICVPRGGSPRLADAVVVRSEIHIVPSGHVLIQVRHPFVTQDVC